MINFAYSVEPVPPKLVVMPFKVKKSKNDYFLSRQAATLKSRIEDYISFENVILGRIEIIIYGRCNAECF